MSWEFSQPHSYARPEGGGGVVVPALWGGSQAIPAASTTLVRLADVALQGPARMAVTMRAPLGAGTWHVHFGAGLGSTTWQRVPASGDPETVDLACQHVRIEWEPGGGGAHTAFVAVAPTT